ncbi:glycosyltransferase family 4 protein [Sphingomonas sp.]|uniref:glycosyltransferase family 4 protein n=1 Tax=Sphingomonas sp. TaxID=28214 RepID=UPI003AFF8531
MNSAAGGRADAPEIVLDLSRLVSRVRHRTPTGVDRCEMAYARELIARVPERLSFGVMHPTRRYGRLSGPVARAFLNATQAAWDGDRPAPAEGGWPALGRTLWAVRPRPVPPARSRRIFLQSSPHHLHRRDATAGILRSEGGARFVCLLHDLIPHQFPEYARPGGAALHRRRMRTVAALADAAIANSDATRDAFMPWLRAAGREAPVVTALLGLDAPRGPLPPATRPRPYFLCLGTIEPRKNHLLLLHLWRRLAEEMGEACPLLVIVGRRGWENEQVVDMLERCPAITPHIEERAGLPDREVAALIAGARALLLPSFAEGYGLPVPEALVAGTPVIASDLPALRQAGGGVPDYLDPLDGLGWMAAIRDYARANSPRRAAQLGRLGGWRAPDWGGHIETVLDVIGALA